MSETIRPRDPGSEPAREDAELPEDDLESVSGGRSRLPLPPLPTEPIITLPYEPVPMPVPMPMPTPEDTI